MNNAIAMSASFEAQKNRRATMITAGFAAFMILLLFLWKWKLPVFEKEISEPGIEVILNLPEEPITPQSGGGGGGNQVLASNPAGIAPATPVVPGVNEDSKDIETDNNEKETPEVVKPQNPKPVAKVVENTSIVKNTPKPVVIENPSPPKPKAVLGKTVSGTNTGGGVSSTYERTGGTGNGTGVGIGNGTGGGNGNGTGGGNGNGVGPGAGPKVTKGDRRIVSAYAFQGDLEKATVYADIKVSEDGIGQFMQYAKGSTATGSSYRTAISQYLRNMRFDKANHESVVTVQFNFRVTN
jgi:hypothetical protein